MPEDKNHKLEPTRPPSFSQKSAESLFESAFQEIGGEKVSNSTLNTPLFDANSTRGFQDLDKSEGSGAPSSGGRSKSALRLKYEQEVQKIQKHHGKLEDIRATLGLSQRKMALLLMVDPSAWTCWTQGKSEAPPHVWRALQWYMILQEKHPEMKSSVWLNTLIRPQISPQEVARIQQQILKYSKDELTQKAIHYVAEEDHKRNRLIKELRIKEETLKRLQKLVKLSLAGQGLLLAAAFGAFLFWN